MMLSEQEQATAVAVIAAELKKIAGAMWSDDYCRENAIRLVAALTTPPTTEAATEVDSLRLGLCAHPERLLKKTIPTGLPEITWCSGCGALRGWGIDRGPQWDEPRLKRFIEAMLTAKQ